MAQKARPVAPPAPKGQMYMMVMMLMMVFVMLDPSLSQALGAGMSLLLNPSIGLGGRVPVISIFLAGAITGVLSTGLRHWSSDYIALERGRILQRTFQKEMNEARLKRDVDRVDRLRRAQPFMMSRTMEANYATMKPAIGTMVVALAVFGWLRVFLASEVHFSSVSVPWAAAWSLSANTVLPNYILLYMVMSLPLTLVIGAALKLWRYREFDPKAVLSPMPTVEDLVRKADGQVEDEELVRAESARAKRRLKGGPEAGAQASEGDDGGAPDEEDVAIVDGESDGTEIVEDDGDEVRIVEPGRGGGGKEKAKGAPRDVVTAHVAEDKPGGAASHDEE